MGEDWESYYQIPDPTELWNFIITAIKRHMDVMCPLKYIRIRLDSPPWINQEVIELINDRSMCYRKVKASGLPDDVRYARQARNRINRFIKSSKTSYIKETLMQYKNDPKFFLRILNNSQLKENRDSSHVTIDDGNGNYTGIDESCEFINDHFASVGARLHDQFKNNVNLDPFRDMYNINTSEDPDEFTLEEILSVVKNINVHKGSGIDYVPTFALKDCFEVICPQHTYMFNQSLIMGVFPESWSVATITPIPKSGNKCLVNNWRPISIIPLVGKLLEKLCVKLLNSHLDLNNILVEEQYGFRPKKSTSLAIFTYIKNITDEINRKKIVGAIYLDFAKAFDSINHAILLAKLENMGLSMKLSNWIKSYLGNRSIRSKLNNNVSLSKDLLCGVPQGSVLGPTLFLCYINDLALTMKSVGASIGLFADDAVIYCSNYDHFFIQMRLERVLEKIKLWCALNCINMNVEKTKFCLYGTRKMVDAYQSNTIGPADCQILQCRQYNYLGVTLDECLNMHVNFNKIFKKFSYKNYQFTKLRKYVDTNTSVLIYKQTVLPLVEYVSFMLCFNNKQDVEKLQRLQNRSLRLCFNINVPMDFNTAILHENARIDKLCDRRDLMLLCLMYDLCHQGLYERKVTRITRAANGFMFDLMVPQKGVYSKSPYYIGASKWNSLPVNIRKAGNKEQFKQLFRAHRT